MPTKRTDIVIPQQNDYDIFGGHCVTIMGESDHHKKRACLMIGQGSFSMLAYLPPATLREIAAALEAVADEIDPPKTEAQKDMATLIALRDATGAASIDDSTDSLLRPTTPAETCGDCHGEGTVPSDLKVAGGDVVVQCDRCNGVGKLYPTGTVETCRNCGNVTKWKP